MLPNSYISVKHANVAIKTKWYLSPMDAGDPSQITQVQTMVVFLLLYTDFLLITYWCVLNNVSNSITVF